MAIDSSHLPRWPLLAAPTPLHLLPRLSEHLGLEVWAKRDDSGPVATAGNKARKLELIVGAAARQGVDCLIMVGAAQSNAARATAAAAAAAGMRCRLVLSGAPPPREDGNLLLDRLLGADITFAGDVSWPELDRRAGVVAAEESAAGRNPLPLPVGCSTPTGAAAFAVAYEELAAQLDGAGVPAEAVYHASSSGGTAAGLLLGWRLRGGGPAVVSVDVGRLYRDVPGRIAELASAAAAVLRVGDPGLRGGDVPVRFDHIGPGYGRPGPGTVEAVRLLATLEGIVCDPVYSGKALEALIADARAGTVAGPVVFWHTGGAQSVLSSEVASTLELGS